MNYYLILSEGCYSDYSPEYYVGTREITQEEYDTKAREFGDIIIAEWENAPLRPHVCPNDYCCWNREPEAAEKYNPKTGEKYYQRPKSDDWLTLMREWIIEQGFSPLPKDIPEMNIEYSDVPHNG